MNVREESIGYGELALVSPYEIQILQDLTMTQTMNDHVRLSVTGIIPEDKKDSYLAIASNADQIELNQVSEGQLVRPLFKGFVTEVAVRSVHDIYYIELEAVSQTFRLDIQRKSRSFQDTSMKYSELIDLVLASYPGSDSIDNASMSTSLENFVLQYKETDWQFLKRMASHFGSVLVAEVAASSPKLWFGVPEGRIGELPDHTYRLKKNLSVYRRIISHERTRPLAENDVRTYVIESTQRLALGDRVRLKGEELVVITSIARMSQGVLVYEYHLTVEAGIRQAKTYLPSLSGVSLTGKVLEVAKTGIRLHLAIDAEQSKDKAIWFPLASPYTAEGHSGFYWSPEVGDTVHLAFPNREEKSGIVHQGIRKGGDSNPKMADHKVAYWGTPHGKELKFDAQAIGITAKEGAVFLKLHETEGIEVHSQQPLSLKADQDLQFTGRRLTMNAGESMHFTCDASSLVLDGITDIQGDIVAMNGSLKAPISLDEEAEGVDELELGLDVGGMIPLAGGADG